MSEPRKADRPPRVDVPITAMLDMSFQLLFFFLLNYSPSHLEGQMTLALPSQPEAVGPQVVKPPPSDPKAEIVLPADLTITVKAVRDGGPTHGTISQIGLGGRAGEQVVPTLDALTERLEKARDRLDNRFPSRRRR